MIKLTTPISKSDRLSLKSGDEVLLSGIIYTARDAAHKKILDYLKSKQESPFEFDGQVVYYVGPTPAKPGYPIGSCGPTSSYRMDPFSVELMPRGLKIMIGKGDRSENFKDILKQTQSVYLVAIGGIGALLAKSVLKSEVIAYPELQSEAIHRLEVKDFPCIVAYDAYGNDVFHK
ncbi:MAG: fumarate hydratase C-terminal domain-containing protein [Bacilli bacterium]|nr:fumarate hydratase C-terminal domain-containing protein [Bacilli bacterium]